jgi:hypothetical protein
MEQQLRSQYRTASVGNNGVVVRTGTVVVVQQDGIAALPAPSEWPCNSYKQGGRIKQSSMCALNWSPSKDSTRLLQVGEKAYLTAIQVKPSEIVFKVQTCCDNAVPYRAAISFQFQKGYLDSMKFKDVQDMIGQIFAPDASSSVQGSDQSQPNPAQGAQQSSLSGLYIAQDTGNQLQLNPDGSFSLGKNGYISSGHFTVSGDTLVLTYLNGFSKTLVIQGGEIYLFKGGPPWVRQGNTPAPVISPVAPLKLPSTYVSTQSAADQLQLNADNSFVLQEGGQSYHGTFVVKGNTLELNISENSTKTTVSMQGNNLTDSSGQAWALREQSAPTASGGDVLRNEDIIKMVKVGIDDATIIAKIGSSKCQFDTSTDALIQLKQSGASAAVLKAVLAAGK